MTTIDLDEILVKLCKLVIRGQETDPNQFGMVAACIIGADGSKVGRVNYKLGKDRVHAERAAIDAYQQRYGPVTPECICVTTLSPCCNAMSDRFGASCSDLLADKGITRVYAGYKDPTQTNSEFTVTDNVNLQELCKRFADTFLKQGMAENFADGRNPGRKGLAKRSGVNTKASVSTLRNVAKHSSGEKQRMAHWLANMKAGRAKAKK